MRALSAVPGAALAASKRLLPSLLGRLRSPLGLGGTRLLLLAVAGSAAILAGRLVWNVPPLVYGGGAFVLGASIWNLWLKRPAPAPLVNIGIRNGERTS